MRTNWQGIKYFIGSATQGPSGNPAASLKWAAEAEPSELFAFKECQDLFRKRLREPMLRLIPQLTGLRLHVLWHRPLNFQGSAERPVLCPKARQRAGAHGRPPKCCQSCLQRRWKPALSPANQGRRFIGQCGATNFCARLQVDNICPLTLVLQARVASRSPSSKCSADVLACDFWRRPATSTLNNTGRDAQLTRRRGRPRYFVNGPAVSPAAFHDAVALVRLILHDLESTAQARMAGSRLENALRKLNHTQTEATRLRGGLHRRLPDFPASTVQPGLGSHAQKLVEVMADYVYQHGHRPISLDELASAMKRNASYLSALFSQTTGVTFHQFLENIRLSKAKELLRNPRNRVGKVARATGYASPDTFRHAFKAHEGLSPDAWRAGQ